MPIRVRPLLLLCVALFSRGLLWLALFRASPAPAADRFCCARSSPLLPFPLCSGSSFVWLPSFRLPPSLRSCSLCLVALLAFVSSLVPCSLAWLLGLAVRSASAHLALARSCLLLRGPALLLLFRARLASAHQAACRPHLRPADVLGLPFIYLQDMFRPPNFGTLKGRHPV